MRKTKIICTLGPATESYEMIKKLVLAGMDCGRLNFSHGTHEEQKQKIDNLKKVRKDLDTPVAILLDTKGPEIRLKTFKNEFEILEEGQTFTLMHDDVEGTKDMVSITFKDLYKNLKEKDIILLNDGLIKLEVQKILDKNIICTVLVGGKISNRKGVNIPNVNVDMEYLSDVDKSDILFGISQGIDYIAASFVRQKEDVEAIRKILLENDANHIKIIAKIENSEGLKNIDDILSVADGIMVARGDLGVEIDFAKIPVIQKKLVDKAHTLGKMVIIATQMLESMTENSIPTRAEVTDIANAIMQGATAIMLSGESAAGKHPIKAVETMSQIASINEESIDYAEHFYNAQLTNVKNKQNAMSVAACDAANYLNADAIICITKSGKTARKLSANYPNTAIIVEVLDERYLNQLNLCFGVKPIKANSYNSFEEMIEEGIELAKKTGIVKKGSTVIILGGSVLTGKISDTMKILEIE